MRAIKSLIGSALALTLVMGFVQNADARTVSAAAGRAIDGRQENSFNVTPQGVSAPAASTTNGLTLVIPISLDTGGTKGFIVRGTAIGVTCVAMERGSNNQMTNVPVTSVSNIVVPALLNVTAGDVVTVHCTFLSSLGRVLSVDHTP